VLVQAAAVIAFLLLAGRAARRRPPRRPRREPFEILDNSFLVEEAFNQERGIFQNIFGFTPAERRLACDVHAGMAGAGMRHQLSYTLRRSTRGEPVRRRLLNYRFQALEEGPGRPAFSPRQR
jgi:hypothetical protein